jgi:FkbM family methyltransferase
MTIKAFLKRQAARWLPRLEVRRHRRPYKWFYPCIRDFYNAGKEPVSIRLHGFEVVVNPGNTYPSIAYQIPLFNAPLVQLVHLSHAATGRRIKLVDVGAATGDTILLIEQRCPGKVEKYVCIEGDPEFSALLRENMRQFPKVKIIQSLLASERRKIRSLEKHHLGTAAATGGSFVDAVPLDDFFGEQDERVDVLKIDVDGYDGEVLQGAKKLLRTFQPWVIFEWHPVLAEKTGQGTYDAFEALIACGYRRFLWFNNVGTFSHFTDAPTRNHVTRLKDYLVAVNHRADEHFDVIALPDSAPPVETDLAGLEFARSAACNARVL